MHVVKLPHLVDKNQKNTPKDRRHGGGAGNGVPLLLVLRVYAHNITKNNSTCNM